MSKLDPIFWSRSGLALFLAIMCGVVTCALALLPIA